MITNYDKFRDDRLNEGLWDSLKSLFGKLLQGVTDEIKKPVDELNNKLSKTKDPKQMEVIMANYLKVHNTTLMTQLKNTKDLSGLKIVVKDNLTGIYAAITASSKTLGKDTFTFSEIFGDSPAGMKTLFDSNETKFKNNLDKFTNDLIVTQAAQFPSYSDKKVTLEKLKNPEQVKNEADTKKVNDVVQGQGGVAQKESVDIKENIKLNEEADSKAVDPKVEEADFQKLKDSMKKWFDLAIYKKVNDTLKSEKTAKPSGTLEDKIKNMTATKNAESVNKMVDALTKVDMAKLKQIRDLLGLDKNTAPL